MTARPQLWVFAGPNGAGKTTLVERFGIAGRMPIVNPDTIAAVLRQSRPSDAPVALEAGRDAVAHRRSLITARQSFGIETTLTGHSETRVMRAAHAAGYKITVIFIGLDGAMTAIARVRERVARGGHSVPPAVVLRRFDKGLVALPATLALADRWFVLDNSADRTRLLLSGAGKAIRYAATQRPGWARHLIDALQPRS